METVTTKRNRTLTLLSLLILVMLIAATATGIFDATPGSPFEGITERGQHAIFQGRGFFSLSAVAFILGLSSLQVARLPEAISSRFPRKTLTVYLFVMSGALLPIWLARIIPETWNLRHTFFVTVVLSLPTGADDNDVVTRAKAR